MRILVTDGMDQSAVSALRADGHEVVEQFFPPEELGKALRDFDVAVVRSKTSYALQHQSRYTGSPNILILFERNVHKGHGRHRLALRGADVIPPTLTII